MMQKHTPGPWHYQQGDSYNEFNANVFSASGMLVHLSAVLDGEDEANVRLIAAAPELLAALRELVDILGNRQGVTSTHPTLITARAAIAKAESAQ